MEDTTTRTAFMQCIYEPAAVSWQRRFLNLQPYDILLNPQRVPAPFKEKHHKCPTILSFMQNPP